MPSLSPARGRFLGVAGLTVCLTAGALTPAAAAPGTLSRAQIHKIVKFTGFQQLSSHGFQVADQFTAGVARFKVLRMDGARLAVSRAQIRRDVAQAITLAARGDTFTTKIKVGPGHKQRIAYRVSPMSDAVRRHLRYIAFVPHRVQLDNLTRPQRVPFAEALTMISRNERHAISLLHNNARTTTWGSTGLSSNQLCTMVESLNAVSNVNVSPATLRRLQRQHVDLSYLTDPNHPNPTRHRELLNLAGRGFEIWSNSLGFATIAARSGYSYQHYLRTVDRLGFAFYKRNQMQYLKMSAEQYREFAQ
jgi:hypothetical protein